MGRKIGFLLSGLAGATAMLALMLGLEMQVASARPGITEQASQYNVVNRTLKGDRLAGSIGLALPVRKPSSLAPTQTLPDGCEPAISSIMHTPLARTPSRCVS